MKKASRRFRKKAVSVSKVKEQDNETIIVLRSWHKKILNLAKLIKKGKLNGKN